MAYEVIYQADYAAPTYKSEEDVVCQIAKVTNRSGDVSHRMEARIQADNPRTGYVGMTKTALVFDDLEGVRELAAQLLTMATEWEDLGLTGKVAAAPKAAAPEAKVVKRRPKNAAAPKRGGGKRKAA